MKRVAIIGAGPAGLVSAKECLAQGLDVTVFEKTDRIGGLWNAGTGHVWDGMRTNLSSDTCRFPDFPHQRAVDTFPTQMDMLDYLRDYTDHHDLERVVRYDSEISNVSQNNNGWDVELNTERKAFDGVIVASGFFSTPYVPKHWQEDERAVHSTNVGPFNQYSGQKVCVIGNAFSGCDIAAGLAGAKAKVRHAFRRPYWLLPRNVEGVDVDRLFYQHSDPENPKVKPSSLSGQYRQSNEYFSVLCEGQLIHETLKINPESAKPPYVAIADGYLEAVGSGTITLSAADHIDRRSVDADKVILATGYNTNLSFLDQTVRKALNYDASDRFMPALIGDMGLHPKLDNMAFVGMYRGPYFLTMALQAQMAARTLAGETLVSQADISQNVARAKELREMMVKPQFPYGDYTAVAERLASILGIEPKVKTGDFLPEHFAP
ncbi:MAG: NAD(P)-binding domain-containing protein [Alphaproteobacteria bacterium]|nr:NAD(P)-binding domain-containing protein [Alphaproteobacteria bacterium]